MTGQGPLCPGGRCGQILAGVAQWRQDFRAQYAEHLADWVAGEFRASLTEAGVSWEVRREIELAFVARLRRIAEGASDVPAR